MWAGLKLDLKAKDYALSEKFLKAAELRDIVKAQQAVIPLNLYQIYGLIAMQRYSPQVPLRIFAWVFCLPVVDVMVRKVKTPMDGEFGGCLFPMQWLNKQVKIPLVPAPCHCLQGGFIG